MGDDETVRSIREEEENNEGLLREKRNNPDLYRSENLDVPDERMRGEW